MADKGGNLRTIVTSFRVSAEEWTAIKRRAEQVHLPPSAFVRESALSVQVNARPEPAAPRDRAIHHMALLLIKMLRYIAEPFAGVATIFIVSPFLVLFAAIPPLRSTGLRALKQFISELLSLVVVTAIIGIIATMASQALKFATVDHGQITHDGSYLGGPDYFMTICVAVFFFFTMDKMVSTTAALMESVSGGQFNIGFRLPGLGRR